MVREVLYFSLCWVYVIVFGVLHASILHSCLLRYVLVSVDVHVWCCFGLKGLAVHNIVNMLLVEQRHRRVNSFALCIRRATPACGISACGQVEPRRPSCRSQH